MSSSLLVLDTQEARETQLGRRIAFVRWGFVLTIVMVMVGVNAFAAISVPIIAFLFSSVFEAKSTKPGTRQARLWTSGWVVALSLYLPFSWLLVMDYPWSAYRFFWLKLWPILPGFVAGLYSHNNPFEFEAMRVATVVLLAALTWLGSIGPRWRIAAAGIALLISLPSAGIA